MAAPETWMLSLDQGNLVCYGGSIITVHVLLELVCCPETYNNLGDPRQCNDTMPPLSIRPIIQ